MNNKEPSGVVNYIVYFSDFCLKKVPIKNVKKN